MIIEGLLTTSGDSGPHIAALGPVVDAELKSWLLRPFQSSTTFQLLRQNGTCVFHVVDDVLPLVQAAIGLRPELACQPHPTGGWILESACHWYKLQVIQWNISQPRAEATAEVVDRGSLRPFWGWNRAKHAALEGAILASRLHLLDADHVRNELQRLQVMIDKTAGDRERAAWELLSQYIGRHAPWHSSTE